MRKRTPLAVVVGVLGILAAAPARADLIAYWDFNEASGATVLDRSGNGHHGTIVNAQAGTRTTAGKFDGGLLFPGTTGTGSTRVTFDDIDLGAQVSFAAWVNMTNAAVDNPILAKENAGTNLSYWFGVYGGNMGALLSSNGSTWHYDRDQGTITNAGWYHVATTWDGTTLRHYVNGALLAQTSSFSGPVFDNDVALVLGANDVGGGNTAFNGAVDEVRIYGHALSQSEVTGLQSSPVPEPGAAALAALALGALGARALRREPRTVQA